MNHVAIMKKSWKLLPKILSGEKTIESRWYMNKSAPWDRIRRGETVYFKDSGSLVIVKATVSNVLQFSNLTPLKLKQLLEEYGGRDGIGVPDIDRFYERFKHKKYCLLIFLKDPEPIKPFGINKKGFGLMAAWLCVEDIHSIKI